MCIRDRKENYDVKSYKKVGFEIVDGNEEERMGKKLSQMNLEELWQLFPIFLTEHEECWKDWYHEEETALKGILPSDSIKRISHIAVSYTHLDVYKRQRPYLSKEQIDMLETLQKVDVGLLVAFPNYEDRKRHLEWYKTKLEEDK